jgi:hypothetical protein
MASEITPGTSMTKTCNSNVFQLLAGGANTLATPGAAGDILFNHEIPSDVKNDFQQCLYVGQ